jgi:hypothetical protein
VADDERGPWVALERLALVGGALWAVCYAVALIVGARAQVTAFPTVATLLNVSWEFAFAVVWPPESRASRWIYRAWLALDLGLLAEALAWGERDLPPGPWQDHFQLLLVGVLGAAFIAQWRVYRAFQKPQLQAYVVNLVMSVSFLAMFYARPQGEGLSVVVAVLKLLGTLCISTANVLASRPRFFAHPGRLVLFASILVLDVAYLMRLVA